MDPAAFFAGSYAEARERFLAVAAARGAAVERHTHPDERGAQGEALTIDVARLGPIDAPALLLVSSGTHGVEGFAGSACQIAVLADTALPDRLAATRVAMLFVHAVNPYGFSHLRRVNEDNADLNRNFLDFGRPVLTNSAYAELHRALLPASWPPSAQDDAVLGAFVARAGRRAYQAAVSGGQYDFPDGMFYGGSRPAWSNGIVRAVLRAHAAARERLGWIDLHTGLGPTGHGERILAGDDDAPTLARARAWWGPDVTSFHDGSSTSAPLTGVMYRAAYEECPGVEYTGIAMEFGTVPIEAVFAALRAEHWLHIHPEAAASLRPAIKAQMRAAFDVDTAAWRQAVVHQAREACAAALDGLASVSETAPGASR